MDDRIECPHCHEITLVTKTRFLYDHAQIMRELSIEISSESLSEASIKLIQELNQFELDLTIV